MSTTSSSKQTLIQSIEKIGWHLNNEFIDDLLQEKPNISLNELIKISLDSDFKDIGRKHIPEGITNGKCDCLEGPCVLQLSKVRNIAAPKDHEHLASSNSSIPAFFKIALTDGVTNCTGLVMEDINKLNIETPPGTKLLLKGNVKTKMSSLLLTNQTCEVLGGHVEQLVSKWKINKDLSHHVRTGNANEGGAPPPWVPFGSKQTQTNVVDTTKKTLTQQVNVENTSSEFSQARQAALAEAVQKQLTITKKFTQQNIVAPTQQPSAPVTDGGGRPVASASTASASAGATTTTRESYKSKGAGGPRNARGGRNDDEKADSAQSKPSQLTLFDVLKSKLPELKDNEQAQQSNDNNKNSTTKQTNDTRSSTPPGNTSNNSDQQSTSTNQYQSNNKRYSQSNNEQQLKDRKNNLPPRLQRANEEQQQQRYNNNNNNNNNINTNTNYQNNRRRFPNNSNKYNNEINNNTQQYHYQDQQQQQQQNYNDYSTDDTKQQITNTNKQQQQQQPQQQQQNDNQQQVQQQQSINNNTNDNNYNNYNKNSAKNRRYNNNGNMNNMNQNTSKYNSNRNSNRQQYDYDNNNNNSNAGNNTNVNNTNNNPNMNYNQYYYPSNRSNYHKQSNKNGYYMPPPQQQQVPPQVASAPAQIPANIVPPPPYINFQMPFYYDNTNPYYPNNPNYAPLASNGQPQPATTVPLSIAGPYDPTNGAYYSIPISAIPIIAPQIPIPPTVAPQQQQPPQPPQLPQQPQQQQTPPPQQTQEQQQQQQQQQYDSKSTIVNDNNNNISQNDSQLDNSANINKNNLKNWKIGDRCMAKYYQDNRLYPAQIQHIDKNSNTCQVIYEGYDGIENVKMSDLRVFRDNTQRNSHK